MGRDSDECIGVTFPCPQDWALIEELGRGAAEATMTWVRLYLTETATSVDPLYGESADGVLYGEEPENEQVQGEHRETFRGPYEIRAIVEFLETGPGGTNPEPSEYGGSTRVTGVARIPRNEFRKLKMVEAPAEEAERLPFEGDVLALYERNPFEPAVMSMKQIDPNGVGPWYFRVVNASFGEQIGGSNYWVEQVLELEMSTSMDPQRFTVGAQVAAHNVLG